MNEIVKVSGQEVVILEYKGKRVVTLEMIDQIHKRPPNTASRTMSKHRQRLKEGEDFYHVDYTENHVLRGYGKIPPRGLIVITESGYLILVKAFQDDLAWKIQRELVKIYFRAKNKGILQIELHTNERVQKDMSKAVNAHNYYKGGVDSIINYNIDSCIAHTGRTPKQIKSVGKINNLPSKKCQSAKEVLRALNPEIACCMSLADNLVDNGGEVQDVFKITKQADKIFKGILQLGLKPAELEQ